MARSDIIGAQARLWRCGTLPSETVATAKQLFGSETEVASAKQLQSALAAARVISRRRAAELQPGVDERVVTPLVAVE